MQKGKLRPSYGKLARACTAFLEDTARMSTEAAAYWDGTRCRGTAQFFEGWQACAEALTGALALQDEETLFTESVLRAYGDVFAELQAERRARSEAAGRAAYLDARYRAELARQYIAAGAVPYEAIDETTGSVKNYRIVHPIHGRHLIYGRRAAGYINDIPAYEPFNRP